MLKWRLAILLGFAPLVLLAKIWVYPKPGEGIEESPYFKVKIEQDEQQYESFVNFNRANTGNIGRSNSWTNFSFDGKIWVEVEVLNEDIQSCIIRPKSDSIEHTINGRYIRFELTKNRKLALEINGDQENVLFLFADLPEENIPQKQEKGLWYFKPGIHDIGIRDVPDSVKHIYIEGGAWVYGAFVNKHKASGFKITGRGILSSQKLSYIPRIIHTQGEGINAYVEGITLCNTNSGGIELKQKYSTLRNCKFFAWQEKTDGVECGEHAVIDDCFFRLGGDALKLYSNNLIAQNCVFWQNETGAPFQLSWNRTNDIDNLRISDCDVICCERTAESYDAAIFSSVHGGKGKLRNFFFKDIRIEGDVYRLFKLTIRTNTYVKDPGYGSIHKLYFTNIKLEGKSLMANEIWGYNQEHSMNNVVFDNLFIDGVKIENEKDGNFKINLNTATGVLFK